jgi:hypothetical protein
MERRAPAKTNENAEMYVDDGGQSSNRARVDIPDPRLINYSSAANRKHRRETERPRAWEQKRPPLASHLRLTTGLQPTIAALE